MVLSLNKWIVALPVGLVAQGNNMSATQLVSANHSIRWSGRATKHGISL